MGRPLLRQGVARRRMRVSKASVSGGGPCSSAKSTTTTSRSRSARRVPSASVWSPPPAARERARKTEGPALWWRSRPSSTEPAPVPSKASARRGAWLAKVGEDQLTSKASTAFLRTITCQSAAVRATSSSHAGPRASVAVRPKPVQGRSGQVPRSRSAESATRARPVERSLAASAVRRTRASASRWAMGFWV